MKWPEFILEIIDTLNQNGFEAYLVGGCLRDALLNRECHDYDIATQARPEQILNLFENCQTKGMSHGTIVVSGKYDVEITTFRKESTYSDHRHPDSVSFVQDIKEDLYRRDFTVNAMAYHPEKGIIDLFNGQKDLKDKILKTVKDASLSFQEDALRMLRAFRFCAKLQFKMDDSLKIAIEKNKHLIQYVSKERIWEELSEILKYDPFQIEEMVDLLEPVLPELKQCYNCQQNSPYHFTNVLSHSLLSVSYCHPYDETIAYALLFHDLGKPQVKKTEKGVDHFKGHPKVSYEIAKRICTGFKVSNRQKERIEQLVYYHDDGFTKGLDSVYKFRIELNWDDERLNQLIEVRRCDLMAHSKKGRKTLHQLNDFIELYEKCKKERIFTLKELNLNGKDIQNCDIPKEKIKEVLKDCLKYVFYHPDKNDKETLMLYIRDVWK